MADTIIYILNTSRTPVKSGKVAERAWPQKAKPARSLVSLKTADCYTPLDMFRRDPDTKKSTRPRLTRDAAMG